MMKFNIGWYGGLNIELFLIGCRSHILDVHFLDRHFSYDGLV